MEPNQPQLPQQEAETTYYQPVAAQDADSSAAPVDSGPTALPEVEPVQWEAIEYLQHTKTPVWYVLFGLVVIALMLAAIFLMSTWSFALLIPVMAGALMIYSHRPARELHYVLSENGLYINDQLHPMDEFRAFGVVQGSPLNSLMLVPTKRFRPALTVYFANDVGEQIVDLLGGYLPMEEMHHDAFDTIVQKLRM